MTGIRRYGFLPLLGCIVLLIAEFLQILSFAASFWAWDSSGSLGLWRRRRCFGGHHVGCIHFDYPWNLKGLDGGTVWQSCNTNIDNEVFCAPFHWLNSVRGFENLAIICVAIPVVVIPVYIYVSTGIYHRCFFFTMAGSILLAAVCNIVGVIIYGVALGARPEWTVGWCLFVCLIGGFFDIAGFIILLTAAFLKPDIPPQKFPESHSFYVARDSATLYAVGGDDSGRIDINVSEYGDRIIEPTYREPNFNVAPEQGGPTNIGHIHQDNDSENGFFTNPDYAY